MMDAVMKTLPAVFCVLLFLLIGHPASGALPSPVASCAKCTGRHRKCETNDDGTFSCLCKEGYEPRRPGAANCRDINECLQEPSPCTSGQKCTNTAPGFSCATDACAPGVDPCKAIGKQCSVGGTGRAECGACLPTLVSTPDGKVCLDACKPSNLCTSLGKACSTGNDGKAVCGACLSNLIATPDGSKCVSDACKPTDPCTVVGKACSTGNDGKAVCGTCLGALVATPDKTKCVADACKPSDPCAAAGKACSTGNDGKTVCGDCLPNLVLTPDKKACVVPSVCSPDPCKASNRQCREEGGKPLCDRCLTGFEPPQGNPGAACVDIDECARGDCLNRNDCSNTPGTFACGKCAEGFEEDPATGGCVDKNECAPGVDPCAASFRTCWDFQSGRGYQCMDCLDGYLESGGVCIKEPVCGKGFYKEGLQCIDVDECRLGTNDCDPISTCNNVAGSFECICPEGYKKVGNRCRDIDECGDTNLNDCDDAVGTCTNTPAGSYTCGCTSGYELDVDGFTCNDINECADTQLNDCDDSFGTCTNTPAGSYTCGCNSGYELAANGFTCNDIDECASADLNDCDTTLGTCTNSPAGTYTCACTASGYELDLDGFTCNDINECVTLQPCDTTSLANDGVTIMGQCSNTPAGTYTCSCKAGFTGNGIPTASGGTGCTDGGGCFPAGSKVWVRSSADGSGAEQRDIQDVRVGDQVRCVVAAPSDAFSDHPAHLGWCHVASWLHAMPNRSEGLRKITYRRADGSTGSHTLTHVHYLYVLPPSMEVGTRLDSLEGVRGSPVLPDQLPEAGARMAVAVHDSAGGRNEDGPFSGFEVVEVMSLEEDASAQGWYLFEADSPYVLVDDVVACNSAKAWAADSMFPAPPTAALLTAEVNATPDALAARWWFACTMDSWSAHMPGAFTGVPGHAFAAATAADGGSEAALIRSAAMSHIQRLVGLEGWGYDASQFWRWWQAKYQQYRASPRAPHTAVSTAELVERMLGCLISPIAANGSSQDDHSDSGRASARAAVMALDKDFTQSIIRAARNIGLQEAQVDKVQGLTTHPRFRRLSTK